MKTDATQASVSAEAEASAQKQNTAVVAAEVEAGAAIKTNAVPAGELDPLKPETRKEVEAQKSPRDITMDEIAAKRADKQKELGTQPELSNDDMGLPDDYNQGEMKTLVVKGKEKKVPLDKVMDAGIRTLQKESSADQMLEEAGVKERAVNTRMDELNVREQNVLKREQEFKASEISSLDKPALSESSDVSKQDGLSDDDADAIVDDFYSGDRKKAREAIQTMEQLGRTETATLAPVEQHIVTAEEVANVVRKQSAAQASLNQFEKAYPGIKADVNLQNIVNNESLRIGREHPEYTQEKLLMESGKYVAEKYGSKIVDDTGFREKAVRKAQTDTVIGADVTRAAQVEAQPPTRKEVIAELKQGRR